MKNWLLIPFSFLEALAGSLFYIWSNVKAPHRLTFEKTGIRIIAPKSYPQNNKDNDEQDVYRALMLLRRFDLRRTEMVERNIRIIFLRPVRSVGQYLRVGRVCILSPSSIPAECPEDTKPIVIAGTLVYLAVLAKLKWEDRKHDNIDALCGLERDQIVRELSDALCK